MEAMGEWSASQLGGMYSCTAEEADFMNQLLASYEHLHHGTGGGFSATHLNGGGFWNRGAVPHHHHLNIMADSAATAYPFYSMEAAAAAGFCFSQESSSYSAGNSGYYAVTTTTTTAAAMTPSATTTNKNNINDGSSTSMDFGMDDVTINTSSYLVSDETSECNGEEYSGIGKNSLATSHHRMHHLEPVEESQDENLQLVAHDRHNAEHQSPDLSKSNGPCESSRKRSHAIPPDGNQKIKRNMKSRRNQKNPEINNINVGEEEEKKGKNKAVLNRQNSTATTCCSEEDSYASNHDANGGGGGDGSSSKGGGSQALSGKTRASRGAATDPQSLYARKRRERINERLRILQNLVPNGTKVDISTMLEEAVSYVKFLQLQIKLLSSDDLWMYAPIAYNGMDIGLDLKLRMQR